MINSKSQEIQAIWNLHKDRETKFWFCGKIRLQMLSFREVIYSLKITYSNPAWFSQDHLNNIQ